MTLHRRAVLRKSGGLLLAGGVGGCSLWQNTSGAGGTDGGQCESVACFEFRQEETDNGSDALTIRHSGGRNLPASEVYVSGIAFDWPPVRHRGFTYPWHRLGEVEPTTGIADESLRVQPALVDSVRVLWRPEDEFTRLDAVPVSDCDAAVACFDYIHEGADDALDRLTVRHVGGRDLAAKNVALTGIASEYPPEPEQGRTMTWAELGEFEPAEGIAGHSVRVTLGFVDTVRVRWTHGTQQSFLDSFQLY